MRKPTPKKRPESSRESRASPDLLPFRIMKVSQRTLISILNATRRQLHTNASAPKLFGGYHSAGRPSRNCVESTKRITGRSRLPRPPLHHHLRIRVIPIASLLMTHPFQVPPPRITQRSCVSLTIKTIRSEPILITSSRKPPEHLA